MRTEMCRRVLRAQKDSRYVYMNDRMYCTPRGIPLITCVFVVSGVGRDVAEREIVHVLERRRGGGLGSSTIFKEIHEPYAPS